MGKALDNVKQQWLPCNEIGEQKLLFLVLWRKGRLWALTTSNTALNNSNETENVAKAVDHKPIDSKTCTEFREILSYDRGHSSNTFNIDACSDKK